MPGSPAFRGPSGDDARGPGDLPADLAPAAILAAVQRAGGTWAAVSVAASVTSTNTLATMAARSGAGSGRVFVADFQTAGRGRLARSWVAPPGTSAMFSVVIRGEHGRATPGLLPLLAGISVAEAVRATCGLPAVLKWPNDVMLPVTTVAGTELAKFVGILAEVEPTTGSYVLGMGINVSTSAEELPVDGATSLALAGAAGVVRADLIGMVLARIEGWVRAWDSPGPAGRVSILGRYRELSATLGREVMVSTPSGPVAGLAVDVGPGGELVLDTPAGRADLLVGDVTHLRHG